MNADQYTQLKAYLFDNGYDEEINWCENVKAPTTPEDFASEYIFVVCNSGMKAQIARKIYQKIINNFPGSASDVFNHKGKCDAIDYVCINRIKLFNDLKLLLDSSNNNDVLAWLKSLPWIGDITKYHLAKNYGLDVAKPDRWLMRVAEKANKSVDKLCEELGLITGDRVATVDYVIWRGCNIGIVDTSGDTIIINVSATHA